MISENAQAFYPAWWT